MNNLITEDHLLSRGFSFDEHPKSFVYGIEVNDSMDSLYIYFSKETGLIDRVNLNPGKYYCDGGCDIQNLKTEEDLDNLLRIMGKES